MAGVDAVVVQQDGERPRRFALTSTVNQVLKLVTGVETGALRNLQSDVEYIGNTLVPAGQYKVVLPPAAAEAGFVETQAWKDTLQRVSLAYQTASATSVMLHVGGDKKVK